MSESLPIPEKDAGLVARIRAECDRLARAADRYDEAGQYEYAGGLREAAHHVSTLLPPGGAPTDETLYMLRQRDPSGRWSHWLAWITRVTSPGGGRT